MGGRQIRPAHGTHPSESPSGAPANAAIVAGRYALQRELGEGGMGVVYLARDLETGDVVALKKLLRVDAKSVLRFKREFRSLSGIDHPNLVELYELERESDGPWILTMEFVAGVDLVSHLRPRDEAAPDWKLEATRVARCFEQLARGVHTLHSAGMLHRDLKPSNVLVADHRVVILDFGLVRELDEDAARVTDDGLVSGTPAYMAPEQALGHALSEASDWYAVGVMLYEALTGELPYDGPVLQILRQKLEVDPIPVTELDEDIPRPLAELCAALLQRDPRARPGGEQILARLASPAISRVPRPAAISPIELRAQLPDAAIFTGRAELLEQLLHARAESESGATVVAHVRGLSGVGKTALLEQFLRRSQAAPSAPDAPIPLVLRSRCYESEAMPFKALDGIMDALASHLTQLDDLEIAHLLPSDLQALAQLFPVLERVGAVKKLLAGQRIRSQARTHRHRAEAALLELFERLAERRPLVVWVDDLQWGDLDSTSILRTWSEKLGQAPFLLIFSYRSDEADTSPALRSLRLASDGNAPRPKVYEIDVGPLGEADLRALCVEQLGDRAEGRAGLVERIVRESHGSPFLTSQLTALALAKLDRGDRDVDEISYDVLVAQTRALLTPEATSLLVLLAVAGRPMATKVALRAAGLRHLGRAAVHALWSLNLIRTRESDAERLLEIFHDRVRTRVCLEQPAERLRAIHQSLLATLEESGYADPDWLYTLALGAGDRALALHYGVSAAERAQAMLAFERAAELYQGSLELVEDDNVRVALWREYGRVLISCGRGSKAAEAFLQAARGSNAKDAIELKRLAASHLLRSGRFEQGEALLHEVSSALDIDLPDSDGKALAALVWERIKLKARGTAFKLRDPSEVSASVLARIDVLDELGSASFSCDTLRSTLLQTRSMLLALEAGEPTRIIRALGSAAVQAALSGSERAERLCEELLQRAEAVAARYDTGRNQLELAAARALSSFYLYKPIDDTTARSLEFERILGTMPTDSSEGRYHTRFAVLSTRLGCLAGKHDCHRFRQELRALLQEAQATENVSALLQAAPGASFADETAGRPEDSIARLDAQRALLPKHRFTLLHVYHMIAVMRTACAARQHAWGFACLDAYWRQYVRSPIHRAPMVKVLAYGVRARLQLNAYVCEQANPAVLRSVTKDIDGMSDAAGNGKYRLRGRIAYLRSDPELAMKCFKKSARGFEEMGAIGEMARDRYAYGKIQGGAEGAVHVRAALAMLAEGGSVDPSRELGGYFPELVTLD